VLRAYKMAVAPTVIHAAALWGLGVVGGYHVAFRGAWGPPWGIAGMWLMQALALGLAALLLVGFYLWVVQRVAKTVVRPLPSNVST
jgi:MATE family multidrug resistance protein